MTETETSEPGEEPKEQPRNWWEFIKRDTMSEELIAYYADYYERD